MDFWVTLAFSAFLLASALGLVVLHVRTWRQVQADTSIDERELRFRARQFRRRVQTSGMLGILAVVVAGGHFVTCPPLPAWGFALYWLSAVLVVAWLFVLGVIDALATRFYFTHAREINFHEQTRLRAELRRLHDAQRGESEES